MKLGNLLGLVQGSVYVIVNINKELLFRGYACTIDDISNFDKYCNYEVTNINTVNDSIEITVEN